MILLFEGRDAPGRGNDQTINRPMNPRGCKSLLPLAPHRQGRRLNWYFQRYVENFPSAVKWFSSIEAGTNRACCVERVIWDSARKEQGGTVS